MIKKIHSVVLIKMKFNIDIARRLLISIFAQLVNEVLKTTQLIDCVLSQHVIIQ